MNLLYFQQGILDILYDLFRLTVPEFTEDFSEALLGVGKSVQYQSPINIFLESLLNVGTKY